MDPEACDDLKIIGVRFSVGDDCIALKSGKIYIGSTFKKPCNDVTIRNCFMNEGHGAIVLGSEAGAGLTNLLIERCYFKHTDRGLRIKSRRGRGKDSVIDNVTFRDIYMDNVLTPLTINMFYFCDPDGKSDYVQDRKPLPIDDRTPYLGKFTFERMTVVSAEYALGYFAGLPEQPIGEITISDSTFTVKEDASEGRPIMACNVDNTSKMGFNFLNVKKVNLHNVKASGFVGQEEIYDNVQEVNHD
jgi:polygalacturonase